MAPENSRRRGLLFFAIFVILAQAGLFIFLKLRSKDGAGQVSATASEAPAAAPSSPSTAASNSPSPPQAGATTPEPPAAEPPKPEAAADPVPAPTTPVTPTPTEEPAPAPSPEPKLSPREERAQRERERRAQAVRDKEAQKARIDAEREREKQRMEAEREKQRLEAEREKARAEAEKASQEKARLETERKRLELEKAKLDKENASVTPVTPPPTAVPARPAGSPEIIVVLINPSAGVSSLSRDELRAVYFGRTTIWPNNRAVRAFNRPAASAAGKKFFGNVLRSSAGDFRQHWDSLQLSGNGIAPGTVSSADSMVARVAATSGGIGYILESELPADLKGLRLMRIK